ncbi:hypothetical protein OHB26_16360 [Nocardia sp. NBC_01503]|uniref:hypothetical protein n=1 Tax=Nocardia sp. NBC_01503 TaxID=2975997 RepID=UPI002E7BCA57|nr:hypothetical protein [Nocardia sp. NBC_01503]WTL35624.1 hypothetical protein OHB26_16360 [Nocardia sp. NBC_01503]
MTAGFGPLLRRMGRAVENFQLSLELNKTRPEEARPREAAFARGMACLVEIEGSLERPGGELSEFRRQVAVLVAANTRGLFPYVFDSLHAAIKSIDDGWYDPCLRRSALQLFRENYPGAGELFDADRDITESVVEMDEWLRERAPDVEPLLEGRIPDGLPDGHWWWRLPDHSGL